MWKQKALRLSFKTFCLGDVQQALSEQSTVGVSLSKSFNGTAEVNTYERQLTGRAALDAAKKKTSAKKPLSDLKFTLALVREERLENVNLFGVHCLRVPLVVC